ncbi:hypothetical protein M231_00330 [Tremella mesenterica]|uniref:F-box domain-containing protein n=1 Tax=Tremella mesenterica TaxID=5217 RepID=A0A4Q1BW23_TREME|nr:hypothetical protein M231_00330 [Tremella mesenterica]
MTNTTGNLTGLLRSPPHVLRSIGSHLAPSTALSLALTHSRCIEAGESRTFRTINLCLAKSAIDYVLAPNLRHYFWPPASLHHHAFDNAALSSNEDRWVREDLLLGALRWYTSILSENGRKCYVKEVVVDCTDRLCKVERPTNFSYDAMMEFALLYPEPPATLSSDLRQALEGFPILPAATILTAVLHSNWAQYLSAILYKVPNVQEVTLIPEPNRYLPVEDQERQWPILRLKKLTIDHAGKWCEPLIISWIQASAGELEHLALRDTGGHWTPSEDIFDVIGKCRGLKTLLVPASVYHELQLEDMPWLEEVGITGLECEKRSVRDLQLPSHPNIKRLWHFRPLIHPRVSAPVDPIPVLPIPTHLLNQIKSAPNLVEIRFAHTHSTWLAESTTGDERAVIRSYIPRRSPSTSSTPSVNYTISSLKHHIATTTNTTEEGMGGNVVSRDSKSHDEGEEVFWHISHYTPGMEKNVADVDNGMNGEEGEEVFWHIRHHTSSFLTEEGTSRSLASFGWAAWGMGTDQPLPVWQDYTEYRGRTVPSHILEKVYEAEAKGRDGLETQEKSGKSKVDWKEGGRQMELSEEGWNVLRSWYEWLHPLH